MDGEVATAVRDGDGFAVTLADGRSVRARRLLVTTGLVDELPDVPGLRERWGRDVLHCPYCHGWEVRDQAVGVLASGPMSVHQALLFRQWTGDVTYFSHTMPAPTPEQAEQLAARGITVVDGEVAAVETVDDRLAGVRMQRRPARRPGRGGGRDADGRAGRLPGRSRAGAGASTRAGSASTSRPTRPAAPPLPGVWVAGNVTDLTAQVGAAAAGGAMAAAHINADLVAEDTARAVAAYRDSAPPSPSPRPWRQAQGAGTGR